MSRFRSSVAIALTTAIASFGILATGVAPAAATADPDISISYLSWGVIGLDSNKVTDGPNVFPQGVTVCNTSGSAKTGVDVTWTWTGPTVTAISLTSAPTRTIDIAASSCTEVWWTVEVTRSQQSYFKARKFVVTAAGHSTPTNLELYVEKLISQNRNGIDSITGPSKFVVGSTVQLTMTAFTATMGYGQLVSALVLDPEFFEIQSIKTTYSIPVGRTGTSFYQDACGWDPDSTHNPWPRGTYRSCPGDPLIGDGRIGGKTIKVVVTAKVLAEGSTGVDGLIYDYSGSSYHYNSDFRTVTITSDPVDPTPNPPVALDDEASTDPGEPVEIELPSNDSDPNGDLVTTSTRLTPPPGGGSAVNPAHGRVTVNPNGGVTYTPNDPTWTGRDTFKYWICDSGERCDDAMVTVVIVGQAPPVTPADAVETKPETPVHIDVTNNDSDPNDDIDPESLEKVTDPGHGTVTLDPLTGNFVYTPNPGFSGTDTFTYRLCDLQSPPACSIGTVTIRVSSTTLAATGSNSWLGLWLAAGLTLIGGALMLGRRRSRLG